jgi:hypothetical protein
MATSSPRRILGIADAVFDRTGTCSTSAFLSGDIPVSLAPCYLNTLEVPMTLPLESSAWTWYAW